MTDESVPKRDQWFWTEAQLRAAGWERRWVRTQEGKPCAFPMWIHPENGHGHYPNDSVAPGCGGAYLPEPPPPHPDEALHEIARRLFPRQSRRCMVHAGSDNPFRVDVKNDFGETVVSARKPTREQAALALLCAYIEDHNGLHLVEHVHNVDPRGSHYELRFIRAAKAGQPPYDQLCVASTLDELIDEVVKAVERLAIHEMTDERIGWVAQRVGGHEANGDQERWVARVLESLREWRRCRRQYGPTSDAAKVAGVNLDNVLSTPPERTR